MGYPIKPEEEGQVFALLNRKELFRAKGLVEVDLARGSPEIGHPNRAKHLLGGGCCETYVSVTEGCVDIGEEKRASFLVDQYHHG
ncbi:hypothetical protein D3C78_1274080 [compost metagenome]